MSSAAAAGEERRASLAAGASRLHRFGSQRPRHRETTLRNVQADRLSGLTALPFEQRDQQEEEGDDEPASAAATSDNDDAPVTGTPRATRASTRASPRSAVVARTPAPRAAATAAAAAAATPAQPARAPASPRTPVASGGKRAATKRKLDLRMSSGFSPPFANSRRTSYASEAGSNADDQDQEEDASELDNSYSAEHDFMDLGGDDGAEDQGSDGGDGGGEAQPEDEPEQAEEEKSAAPAPAKKPTSAKKRKPASESQPSSGRLGGGRVGRKTMHIVNRAKELGMVPEEGDDVGSGDEGTPHKRQKRSQRRKLEPLQWWLTQEPNYIRTSTGIGATMPILDPDQPVVQLAKDPVEKPKVDRPRSKQPKNHKKPEQKVNSARDVEALQAADAPLRDPLPLHMTILNSEGIEVHVPTLAKHSNAIPLECLGVPDRSMAPLPHGGKAFEQPEFSSGILSLPPRAKKQREVANNNEVFYVISAPVNGLKLTMHTQSMHLSTGSQFMVPAGNTYELSNSSSRDTIKLMFVLIKPAVTWVNELREQVAAEEEAHQQQRQQQRRRAAVVEEEEEEEDFDSDGGAPVRHRQTVHRPKATKASHRR